MHDLYLQRTSPVFQGLSKVEVTLPSLGTQFGDGGETPAFGLKAISTCELVNLGHMFRNAWSGMVQDFSESHLGKCGLMEGGCSAEDYGAST